MAAPGNDRPPALFVALRALREKKWKDAIALLRLVAATDHRVAQYHLAQVLSNGTGTQADPAEAAVWYRRSAEAGYRESAFNLAALNALGKGVPQSWSEAAHWYERAAELGYPLGATVRGSMYANAEGSPQDFTRAIEWWRRGAKMRSPRAMFFLGEAYRCGDGVEKDLVAAAGWYLESTRIEANDIALQTLGGLREALQSLADEGDPGSACRVGQMFLRGIGGERDPVQGMEWIRIAADTVPEAAFELAVQLRNGRGAVPVDFAEVRRLFEFAAIGGVLLAQHDLAFMFSDGIGGPKDLDQAIRWYSAAADQGRAQSRSDLGICLLQRDPAAALREWTLAAEAGYGPAMINLGTALRDGTLGPKDPAAALRWLIAAFNAGVGDAVHEMHDLPALLTPEQIREADRLADSDGSQAETLISMR